MYLAFLSSHLFRSALDNIWIGMKYNSLQFPNWSDSMPITFTNWGPSEPSLSKSSCIEMSFNGVASWNPGFWKTSPCDQKLSYICQRPLDPALEDNPVQAPNPKNCPKD